MFYFVNLKGPPNMESTTISAIYEKTEASKWNSTLHQVSLEDLKMDSNFLMLLFSLIFAVLWVIYITYYNSRILGYIITKVANKFLSEGYFRIGKYITDLLGYVTNNWFLQVRWVSTLSQAKSCSGISFI